MALLDTFKRLLGSAWHVNSDEALAALLPSTDGAVEASKVLVADASKNVTGLAAVALSSLTVSALYAGSAAISGLSVSGAYIRGLVASTTVMLGASVSNKVGFHGAAVSQRSGAAQAAVALCVVSISACAKYGFTTSDQLVSIETLLNEMRAALVEKGIIAGA